MMVGRRKYNPLGLEPRVYAKHGAFFYVHRDGRWEKLGTDKEAANRKACLYNDTQGLYGTLAYWMDMFVADCEERVKKGTLASRTLEDYRADVEPLKAYFKPPMTPQDVLPSDVQDYLDLGAEMGRPVRANREKACLSSCMSWLIRKGKATGLLINPCLRASGIKRNSEAKRDRYVTHEEYQAVYAVAPQQVRDLMTLTYRTLQRPESDIIGWTAANITRKNGKRIIRSEQNKVAGTSGKIVDIELSAELDALVSRLVGKVPKIGRTLLCTTHGKEKGKPYSYDGISAMLKRAIKKANTERAKKSQSAIPSFGFRDLKGKGATDMWLSGIPIEVIQHLCGHEDKATTETYVKQRWRENATPNEVSMTA